MIMSKLNEFIVKLLNILMAIFIRKGFLTGLASIIAASSFGGEIINNSVTKYTDQDYDTNRSGIQHKYEYFLQNGGGDNIPDAWWYLKADSKVEQQQGFYKFNINEEHQGVYSSWTNTTANGKTVLTHSNTEGTVPVWPGQPVYFTGFYDADSKVGESTIGIKMGSNNGLSQEVFMDAPIVRSTTTTNGTKVGTLVDAGFTNGNDMAYFENAVNVNSDGDKYTDLEEYIAGTNPNDTNSFFRVNASFNGTDACFKANPEVLGREYTLEKSTNLVENVWQDYGSYTNESGSLNVSNVSANAFFKLTVELEQIRSSVA